MISVGLFSICRCVHECVGVFSYAGKMSNNVNGVILPHRRGKSDIAKVTVVLGAQWGDEGKGKVVDMLATDADLVCRCQVR